MGSASETEEAESWDAGCIVDRCRNGFVVPVIVALFEERRPARILDLGAGTGFIARSIDDRLPYRPTWTLLDFDKARLDVAARRIPSSMLALPVNADVIDHLESMRPASYDAVQICFTLLEFPSYDRLIALLSRVLTESGDLIIVLPDPWEEILHGEVAASALLTQRVSLIKTDKFTGFRYPYFLVRTEKVIADFIEKSFDLTRIFRSEGASPAYVFVFRKRCTA